MSIIHEKAKQVRQLIKEILKEAAKKEFSDKSITNRQVSGLFSTFAEQFESDAELMVLWTDETE